MRLGKEMSMSMSFHHNFDDHEDSLTVLGTFPSLLFTNHNTSSQTSSAELSQQHSLRL